MIAAVIVAGAVGAVLRWLVGRWLSSSEAAWARAGRAGGEPNRPAFPWPVLIINVVGSAIAGAVLGLATAGGVSGDWRLILLTGFCGGLTTFSTFSVETIQLSIDRRWGTAALNVGANVVLGTAAAALAFGLTAAA